MEKWKVSFEFGSKYCAQLRILRLAFGKENIPSGSYFSILILN